MYIVGITGGIGSGKTAVSDEFEKLGVGVVDADIGARAVVQKGSPTLKEIEKAFGEDILTPNGELNRPKLREIIFTDSTAKKTLNDITHPAIRQWMQEQAKNCTSDYIIFVIPLLVDTGWGDLLDRILVVDADEAIQIERVMQRDNQTLKQAQNALASQISRKTRLSFADDVITNNKDLNHLLSEVSKLHKKYRLLAGKS